MVQLVGWAVVAVLTVGWLLLIWSLVERWRSRNWPEVRAVVVEVLERRKLDSSGRPEIYWKPVLSFTAQDGRAVRGIPERHGRLSAGEEVAVRYDPARPEKFYVSGCRKGGIGILLLMLMAIPAVVYGLVRFALPLADRIAGQHVGSPFGPWGS
ncbi:hypothetical protein Arub01_04410 [Actinomadura rubrobrunea]|uniref:DUF3592 domain-containing protein n=1 Tax=Actinomadura rubrobrunea TaxID=115335 RepID=A0A9W6PRN4_9ACTN|nr:hypothetical protein Arub01_04410 [Actinomadura rubrobrunea]